MMEKNWEYKGTVHQLFIDLKKAYDSVKRDVLCDILIEFGIPKKLVRLIKICVSKTYSRVRIDGPFRRYVSSSSVSLEPIHCITKNWYMLASSIFITNSTTQCGSVSLETMGKERLTMADLFCKLEERPAPASPRRSQSAEVQRTGLYDVSLVGFGFNVPIQQREPLPVNIAKRMYRSLEHSASLDGSKSAHTIKFKEEWKIQYLCFEHGDEVRYAYTTHFHEAVTSTKIVRNFELDKEKITSESTSTITYTKGNMKICWCLFVSLVTTTFGSRLDTISQTSENAIVNYTFPDGFLLGSSTAAYQIEGGWNEDVHLLTYLINFISADCLRDSSFFVIVHDSEPYIRVSGLLRCRIDYGLSQDLDPIDI
ncbi:hypothetical protein ANN_12739 [Periplaneta americana]|uniref:Reverse transcriptase domain-containing protein n=1 Tax=Periplaneta americana TaxID=6978 RepID=A0ABQ8THE5_PERAM|nr:hypothetical protein ANN_12739 [Periplaneta americana]